MDEQIVSLPQKKRVEIAVSNLIGQPLLPGQTIPVKAFEELLGISRKDISFGFLVSAIRHKLFESGIYISGEGLTETGMFFIEDPHNHHWLTKLAMASAEKRLDLMRILMLNTSLKGFSDLQKRRHESTLREVSLKLTAVQRAKEIQHILDRKKTAQAVEIAVEEVKE